jgi:hypothetical protein
MKRALQMTKPATFLVAVLSVAASASGAAAINSFASGFYQNTGGTPSLGSTNIIEDSTRNNYFAFDLSGVSGTVTSAKLTIFGGNGFFIFNSTTPATVTYSIYDVAANVDALTNHTAGLATFTDLGSGTVYGSTSIAVTSTTFGSMPQFVIDLSGGLNDINAALGGLSRSASSSRWVAAAASCRTRVSYGHPRPLIRPRDSSLRRLPSLQPCRCSRRSSAVAVWSHGAAGASCRAPRGVSKCPEKLDDRALGLRSGHKQHHAASTNSTPVSATVRQTSRHCLIE